MSDSEQMEVIRLNVRISDLEESVLFWKKDAIAGTTRIRELEARIRELEAALRDLFDFHVSNDTQEGHNRRCNRWKGLGCTCGGTRVIDGAKLALAPKEPS